MNMLGVPKYTVNSRASGCLGTSRGSSSTTSPRAGSSSTTSPTPRIRVPRHVAWLVVDYFDYAARPVASARPAARRAARCRLLRLRHASGCLGTSHGSSSTTSPRAGSLSTTSPMPRVQVPRHVARFAVDYFVYATRLGASARRAARLAATPCTTTSSCSHTGSTSATPFVATTCLVTTLALLRVRRAPPRCGLPVASRRPFIRERQSRPQQLVGINSD
jgi:hypothetical protein